MRQFLVQRKLLRGSNTQKCILQNSTPNKGHPNPYASLNNFSDFLFWKNSKFCDFKEDYTFRVSKQFEKKIPKNAKLEKL